MPESRHPLTVTPQDVTLASFDLRSVFRENCLFSTTFYKSRNGNNKDVRAAALYSTHILRRKKVEEKQLPLIEVPPTLINVEKDPEKSGLEQMEDRALVRYCKRHYALIEKLQELGLPAPGQQFRLITRRTFNAIQFLEYICEGETIIDLKMAIYSINYYAAKILIRLVNERKIQSVEILMSNLRNKAHREKEEIIRKMFIGHPHISLFFCSSHAKMFSCSTSAGNYYTLEGSGNLAYNSRVEQYVIDNDKALYDFSRSWMKDIKVFLEGKKELEVCK